ncbi:spatacsin isoform X2 [Procambarus clarkii]|uniref:spatacsin isoform X2 n=1 Tax=Procambarus clarkii TaxID=6728 RepID=UPI003744556B
MAGHSNVNKLVLVKKLPDIVAHVQHVLRTDLEVNNKGFSILLDDGRLIITVWVNKKVTSKVLPDVSGACWQRGCESEVIITCQNGSLIRYSVHFDTGLSCSLQLSAPSLLSLIREKDSSIRSIRSPRVWGHTEYFILLQPQSDRLVLLATNAGGRPSTQGVLRTPPLRTAHLYKNMILAQPITGTDLYEYDTKTCKLIEVVSLGLQRTGSEMREWSSLSCSSTGDTVAMADSERRLYVTNFRHRTFLGRKGGVIRSRVTLHQVIWPTSLQPSRIVELTIGLSDTILTVFCRTDDGDTETQHYLSFDVSSSSISCHHKFAEQTTIIPGIIHNLPDLFLVPDGVAMLMDEEASISSLDSEFDIGELLGAMCEGLDEQNMAKISEVKVMVEQGLSVFLASCNHQEGWVGLAETNAKQYGQLADLLLGYIPRYAQQEESYATALSLKYLAKHHFTNVLEEMSNVLQYIDCDSISQMVLQMTEQVSFYLHSVEQVQLPQAGINSDELVQQHANWGDKPLKEIIEDALTRGCVKSAEGYLQLKPWVYGTVSTTCVIATCIAIAREKTSEDARLKFMLNIDSGYNEVLRQMLNSSDDQFEVLFLGRVLDIRGLLSDVETLAVKLVVTIHKTLPDLLTLPPQRWTELVAMGDASSVVSAPVTVGQVTQWTPLAIMLILTDLYAYTGDAEILENVDTNVMWQYLLYQHDLNNLKRWIFKEFCGQEMEVHERDHVQNEELLWLDLNVRLPKSLQARSSVPENRASDKNEKYENISDSKYSGLTMLSGPLYASDVESSVKSHDSIESSSLGAGDEDSWSVQSFEAHDRRDTVWSTQLFKPITQTMIDLVADAKEPFVELVLNVLARCRVFMTSEKNRAELLLKRLLVSGALEMVADFMGNHSCQISDSDIHTVLMEFFGAHDLLLPAYDHVKDFSLDASDGKAMEKLRLPSWASTIVPFMKLLKTKSKEVIYDLCLKNLASLSDNCKNPQELQFPAFLTMLFAPTQKLQDFINFDINSEPNVEANEIHSFCMILDKHNLTPKQVAKGVVQNFPYLQKMFAEPQSGTSIDVTMYDLLSGTVSFDLSRMFAFQKNNRYGYDVNAEIVSFTNEELVKKHGILHSLEYLYYLRECRPTYACAAILASVCVNRNKKRIDEVKNKVYGFALSSWPNRAVCCACISVLLMTNLEADPLRIVLTAAFFIYDVRIAWCVKLTSEKRKGHETLIEMEIRSILQQVCIIETRSEAAAALLEMLENCVILSVTNNVVNIRGTVGPGELFELSLPLNTVVDMMGNIFSQEIPQKHMHILMEGMRLCVELCLLYGLPWPVKLLTKLVESNQWLLFLVIVQVFNCPKNEVLKVAESFQSTALKEHMMFALTHMYYYRESHQSRDRTKAEHSKRSTLYSKIGIHSREGSQSPVQSGDEKQCSSSPSDGEMSIIDDALSCTTAETSFDVGVDAWLSYMPKDLYSILLTCHQRENPANELVTAAVALSTPVLAVFSACYEKHNPSLCLSVWLYTQLSQSAQHTLHHQLAATQVHQAANIENIENKRVYPPRRNCCRACDVCVLQCRLEEQKWFLLSHVSEGSLDVPIEGLKVFDPHSPLLPLLTAIKEVKEMCNKEKIAELLSASASAVNDSQIAQDISSVKREWIMATTLDVIGTALDTFIVNSHLQYQLLSVLTTVSQLPPFCSHSVNWSLVSQICKILGVVKHQVIFKELLWSFETGEVNEITERIVTSLCHERCFTEALHMCQLTGLPVFTIVCAQLRAEFDKNTSNIIKDFLSFKEFMCRSQNKLHQESVPPKHAAAFFIAISKELPSATIKYLCLQHALMWSYKTHENTAFNRLKSFDNSTNISWELQTAESSIAVLSKLEYEMWQACVKAFHCKEEGFCSLTITPPSSLGNWPWEGEDGTSPLDLGLIMKSAGLAHPFLTKSHVEIYSLSSNHNIEDKETSHKDQFLNDEMNQFGNFGQNLHTERKTEEVAHSEMVQCEPSFYTEQNNEIQCDQLSVEQNKEKMHTKLTSHDEEEDERMVDEKASGSELDTVNIEYKEACLRGPQKVMMGREAAHMVEPSKDRMEHEEKKQETRQDGQKDQAKWQTIQFLVNLCVNKEMLVTACRILRLLKVTNKNVQSLLLLLGMADGSKVLRLEGRSTISRSFNTISLEKELGVQTSAMVKVASELTMGKKTAERIIILYKVAASLDLSYLYLVHHSNPITLVSMVLRLRRSGVVQLARELIHAFPVPQSAVLNFLCEEAVATITAGPGTSGTIKRDRLLLWDELEAQWQELLTLCDDPTLLGNQLLEIGQRMGSSHPDQMEKVHSMSVELVIRAHDCYTGASNMEGIGTVLRTALSLTTSLIQHSQWSLMVRLLIGVGRYIEMSYIIDALRENDQFEHLLGRDSDPRGKETGLDRALVHYLHSRHPLDKDTLKLVALHFLLYSEVAEMWVEDAEKAVEQVLEATVDLGVSCTAAITLRSGPAKVYVQEETSRKHSLVKGTQSSVAGFQGTDEFEPEYLYNANTELLTQAMHSYAHAAQYYMQDQQLATAVEYSRQAELVALQIAYARRSTSSSSLRLLRLTPVAVKYITTNLLRVTEAQLVGRAYSSPVDWSVALYQQYVNNGDESYLTEYLATFKLSPEVMLDVVKKLEHDGITKDRRARVASMLSHVEESDIVYRVASQLGLKDTIDKCLASACAPYLKDNIFVKGCTSGD